MIHKQEDLSLHTKCYVPGLTDGRNFIPLKCEYLFSIDFKEEQRPSKIEIIKQMITEAKNIFSDKEIVVALDGAFATVEILTWLLKSGIYAEMRMHKNRKVFFNNKHQVLAEIKELQLKGRYKARTIKVVWHELALYITAHKRIDKHNEATIVYQVATYQAAPSEHVSNYKKRWPIEKMFRTSKQFL